MGNACRMSCRRLAGAAEWVFDDLPHLGTRVLTARLISSPLGYVQHGTVEVR